MKLEGSCSCGAVTFSVSSQTPYPYMRCYCSICRKTAGGGGYAINIMGDAASLKV
ncbi:MAG TPA: GFA family protein, partial [Casimicrobiaceae bacterium]|nr:GFA family protein [Casimicrobiaceae bacterium]